MQHDHSSKCAHYKCNNHDRDTSTFCSNTSQDCDCDGYHTFSDLYNHRITLFITLCRQVEANPYNHQNPGTHPWRSKNHSDGEPAFGGTWFVLGINKEKGEQITYHLPMGRWDETSFAETLDKAPEFDGHTSDDVLERLKNL